MIKISSLDELRIGDIIKYVEPDAWWIFELFANDTLYGLTGQLIAQYWPGHTLIYGALYYFRRQSVARNRRYFYFESIK